MSGTLAPFVQRKLAVARCLDGGGCGGGYVEAILVVSGLLSGMAADLWPGTGKDKRRFVELWSQCADARHEQNRVSVPLLVERLGQSGRHAEAEALKASRPKMFGPGYESRVLVADDVDQVDQDVRKTCPSLDLKDIRACSYGVIFYEHVRSAIVHEFHFGAKAVGTPMTDRQADVSYSNFLDRHTRTHRRRIHFHLPWLVSIVESAAVSVEPMVAVATHPDPPRWWIDG